VALISGVAPKRIPSCPEANKLTSSEFVINPNPLDGQSVKYDPVFRVRLVGEPRASSKAFWFIELYEKLAEICQVMILVKKRTYSEAALNPTAAYPADCPVLEAKSPVGIERPPNTLNMPIRSRPLEALDVGKDVAAFREVASVV